MANTLNGGDGNDTLNGGAGNDLLTGGTGADTFIFNTTLNSITNKDMIMDFTSGEDIILLENTIFTKLIGIGSLSSENFIIVTGTGKALDANDHIIYNSDTGILSYDADGNGIGAAIPITVLGASAHPTISYSDLMVS